MVPTHDSKDTPPRRDEFSLATLLFIVAIAAACIAAIDGGRLKQAIGLLLDGNAEAIGLCFTVVNVFAGLASIAVAVATRSWRGTAIATAAGSVVGAYVLAVSVASADLSMIPFVALIPLASVFLVRSGVA